MTDINQKGGKFIYDRTMQNLANAGNADIPTGTAVIMDPANDGAVIVPASGGGVAGTCGITIDNIPFGGRGRVRMLGCAVATADGGISRGAYVQVSDTNAKMGRVKTCGAATEMLGQVFETAVDGDPVEVFLVKGIHP
jgi:hypothetical protein